MMDIREMGAGRELDEKVGKAIGATPRIAWYAMGKEETAYYMDFGRKSVAEGWHNDMMARFPDGRYAENGGHIVCREIYKRYSEDISAAWEIVEKMCQQYDFVIAKTQGQKPYCQFVYCPKDELKFEEYIAEADTFPVAICRAALSVLEG